MSGYRTFQVLEALDASPARTRRTWSQSAKDRIVAEANAPGVSVSAVARAHGVNVAQVFRWRREAGLPVQPDCQSAPNNAASGPALSFIEVASKPAVEPTAPIPNETCQIVVAGVILRIGPNVPAQRVVELIRAARLA